ncbi:MAG: DUF1554 domain-containing protein [Deltaproteobacteria bacterium]|nr:DUF1554 domain-containing protein [Deltaproteobacteria bacterium]
MTLHPQARAWSPLLSVGLVVAASCGVELGVPADANVRCTGAAECPKGMVCNPRGACVDPRSPLATLPPAAVLVSPADGLVTSESGAASAFTVVLTAPPTADVTVRLASDSPAEARVEPEALVFTASDWDSPKRALVLGVLDCAADGDVAFTIVTSAAASGDPDYDGLEVQDVGGTNLGDRAAGVLVTPTTGLVTDEDGAAATFSMALACPPAGLVEVTVAASDDSEGRVDGTGLVVFGEQNWDIAQTVSVRGQRDCAADGDISYEVISTVIAGDDPTYDAIPVPAVAVSNGDRSAAGVEVTPAAGLEVREDAGLDTFVVALTCPPAADVTIDLESEDLTELQVSPASLRFTPSDWQLARLVAVTGVPDCEADGDRTVNILTGAAASSDPSYDGYDAPDIQVTTLDVLEPGVIVTVSPPSGLEIFEGSLGAFSVTLACAPDATVTIGLVTSDAGEGIVAPASLEFTPEDWFVPQGAVVTGQTDGLLDGDVAFEVLVEPALSADPDYQGVDGPDVTVTTHDADAPGFIVTPTGGVTSTESTSDPDPTFTVVLTAAPVADVTLTLTSSDSSEGRPTPTSLTFTAGNWQSPQTVAVQGQDDAVDDGPIDYSIILSTATSADLNYDGLDPVDVACRNSDNDTASIRTYQLMANQLKVEYTGATAVTFYVEMSSEPTADVHVPIVVDKPNEAQVDQPELVFTAANWASDQPVAVTGRNLGPIDGWDYFTVLIGPATSVDPVYDGMTGIPSRPGANRDSGAKRLFVTGAIVDGRLGQGADASPAHADALCNADALKPSTGTYKALIGECVNGATAGERVAVGNAVCPVQKNWVLRSNWGYTQANGTMPYARTDAQGLFLAPLTDNSGLMDYFWSGLNSDWTPSADCSHWGSTTGSGAVGGYTAWWTLPLGSEQQDCGAMRRLFCVEQ